MVSDDASSAVWRRNGRPVQSCGDVVHWRTWSCCWRGRNVTDTCFSASLYAFDFSPIRPLDLRTARHPLDRNRDSKSVVILIPRKTQPTTIPAHTATSSSSSANPPPPHPKQPTSPRPNSPPPPRTQRRTKTSPTEWASTPPSTSRRRDCKSSV